MKIGFVIYGSVDTLTGGYLYDKQVVDHLTVRGHRVEVLSLPPRRCLPKFADNFSIKVIQRVTRSRFDVLLQDELCHPSLCVFNRLLRSRERIAVAAVVHHLLCHEPDHAGFHALLARREALYLDSVDGFIFNSRFTQRAVFRLSPAPRPFVIAQPGGDRFKWRIPLVRIEERALEIGPLRLLFVGMAVERKGLLPLVRALGMVDRHRWRLEVVGDATWAPDYTRRVYQAIADLRLASSVRFWGTLDTEPLARLYADSHLLCMPFAYEGFGIVTLEALHFGLPVMGCADGATPELVRHGENGLLFERGDLRAVAAAIDGLSADRRRLGRMSVKAFETALEHPGWEDSMERIEAFLQDLCFDGRRAVDSRTRRQGLERGKLSPLIENADIQDPIRPDAFPGIQAPEEFIRYLAAKKSVDDRALNRTVWRRVKEALRPATIGKPIQVIELGAGTGTMFERVREWDLAPSFHYTMVELSPDCLAAFWSRNALAGAGTPKTVPGPGPEDYARSGPDEVRTVETICADIYDVIADPRHRERYDLIIAHAVMDLLNLEEALSGFTAIVKPGGLFYLSLVYDGHTELLPSGDPEFERDLFRGYHSSMNRRESRGKPSGGSRAARAMLALLAALEMSVLAAGSSDWVVCPRGGRYEAEEAYFLHWIIDTIDNQLQRDAAVDPRRLAEWTGWRHAQVGAGELTLKAQNMDFLVLRPVV